MALGSVGRQSSAFGGVGLPAYKGGQSPPLGFGLFPVLGQRPALQKRIRPLIQ